MENESINMAANAEESAAGLVSDTAAQESSGDSNAAVNSQSNAEDVTQTQAFSRRLNEMSEKRSREAVDSFVASLRQVNPYNGKNITNAQEMRDYQAMRQADEEGRDPETAVRIRSLENELAGYRSREAEAQLANDPELGEFYNEYRNDVAELIEFCRADGREISPADALRAVIANNLGSIRQRDIERAKAETLSRINANAAASPGSVSGEVAGNTADYGSMSDEDFEKVIQRAKRGEFKK